MTTTKHEDSVPTASRPAPEPTAETPRTEAKPETEVREIEPERRLNGRAIWWPSR